MRAALLMVLLLGACSDVAIPSYEPPLHGRRHVFVVAHQDDDLLFMNPDLAAAIRAGHEVRTVFVTASDWGREQDFWSKREAGVRAAYAYMAGAANVWTASTVRVAGKPIVRFTLAAAPAIELDFLRLPDGDLDGAGFGHGSLRALWEGEIARVPVLGDRAAGASYSHAEIVAVLVALLAEAGADDLHTLDATGLYARSLSHGDHSDHVIVARLALEASLAHPAPHRLSMYRTYNLSDEPANLSEAQFLDKRAAYQQYSAMLGEDTYPRAYREWMQRIVAIRTREPGLTLLSQAERCLEPTPDRSGVRLQPCSEQSWDTRAGELRTGELCLEAPELALVACNGAPAQQFRLLDNGQVRGLGATCVDARHDLTGQRILQLLPCARAPGQIFSTEP
jgi:LmbE family N-acetylglucosaminyl deacetylase